DFIIGETFSYLEEAILCVERIKKAGKVSLVTMCYELEPKSYEGYGPAECATRLQDAGADIVGINCLRNPSYTLPLMQEMRNAVSGYIAFQPAAYHTPPEKPDFTSLPHFPLGLDPLQWTRGEMGDYAREAKKIGVNYIGSCCGAVAEHVKEMAKALGKITMQE